MQHAVAGQPRPDGQESVFIGYAADTGERVAWQPGKGTGARKTNRIMVIVGKIGSGKTQLIKACMHEIAQTGIPSIALDWSREFRDVLTNSINTNRGTSSKLFTGSTAIHFDHLVQAGGRIDLAGLQTDDLRVAFGHFLLSKLWLHMRDTVPTARTPFYLVVDEANRLAFPGSPLERVVSESKSYGGGAIIASQCGRTFSDTVPTDAACYVALQCLLDRDASFMARHMNCRAADIQGLAAPFEAMVKFDYEAVPRKVKIVPHYVRAAGGRISSKDLL